MNSLPLDGRVTNIYALIDPRTDEIRYVGKTVKPVEWRLSQHLYQARHRRTHAGAWLLSLEQIGLQPKIKILEVVGPEGNWEATEQRWIAHYRRVGNLTNLTDGGEGKVGWNHSEESKQRMAEAKMGGKHSPETKLLMSKRKKGLPSSRLGQSNRHLDKSKVADIKGLLLEGVSRQVIADTHGVSRALVGCIQRGERWTAVEAAVHPK